MQGIICAWCKKMLKEGKEPYSHGICKDCAKEMEEDLKRYKQGKLR